jgi:hypothetical protein
MFSRHTLLAILLSVGANLAFAADDVLYKWTDADGNTKFGDRPPKGVPFERIKIRKSKSDTATTPITEKVNAPKQEDSEVQNSISKVQQQMAEACKVAKANLKTLNTARKIRISTDDGGSRLLTDEEREAKKKETQEQIDTYCKNEGSK